MVDAEKVGVTVISLLEGVTLLWAFDPEAVPVDEQMEVSVQTLIEALRVER